MKMSTLNKVLLASHGTDGALAAERMTMELCGSGVALFHLIVVPDLWMGITGDDWLNNGKTRDTFRRYLEGELGREVNEHCDRINLQADAHGLQYHSEIVLGEPDACLIRFSRETDFDLIIMGSPRPKGKRGLRSRMTTKKLPGSLKTPLLIVPYPDHE